MTQATETDWVQICRLDDIAVQGARVIPMARGDIALIRCADNQVFAVLNRCPHKQGPLSEGIVHGHRVTCPLHGWVIDLAAGRAVAPDVGWVPKFAVRVCEDVVWLELPDQAINATGTG